MRFLLEVSHYCLPNFQPIGRFVQQEQGAPFPSAAAGADH
jgi:hypothetical protein